MGRKVFFLAFRMILFVSFVVVACTKDKPITNQTSEVETTQEGTVYKVDTMNSRVDWKGFKVFKSDNTSHIGYIKFESGDVTIKDGKLESGKFVADMSSLTNEDLVDNQEDKVKLESHLKSADFFEVENFPTASYIITKVSEGAENDDYNTIIDGNLTIKGITKAVQMKANVVINNGVATIATEPTDILREDFGVKFQSPIENGVIKNEINVQILIKALETN